MGDVKYSMFVQYYIVQALKKHKNNQTEKERRINFILNFEKACYNIGDRLIPLLTLIVSCCCFAYYLFKLFVNRLGYLMKCFQKLIKPKRLRKTDQTNAQNHNKSEVF